MSIELLEKGCVRLWTQVEKSTSACQVDYVFNDTILTQGKVGNTSIVGFFSTFPLTNQNSSVFLHSEILDELRSVNWHH